MLASDKFIPEMHYKHRIVPKTMCELFNEVNVPHNLLQDVSFCSYNVKTVLYGAETLSYLGPKIWNLVPFNLLEKILKILKNRNQTDLHVSTTKYTFLI